MDISKSAKFHNTHNKRSCDHTQPIRGAHPQASGKTSDKYYCDVTVNNTYLS